jgi:hypothetical protein
MAFVKKMLRLRFFAQFDYEFRARRSAWFDNKLTIYAMTIWHQAILGRGQADLQTQQVITTPSSYDTESPPSVRRIDRTPRLRLALKFIFVI